MYTLRKTTGIVKNKLTFTPIASWYEDDMLVIGIPHSADDYPKYENGVDRLFLLGHYDGYGWVYMALVGVQWEVFYIATEHGNTVLRSLPAGSQLNGISERANSVIVAYHTMKVTKVM